MEDNTVRDAHANKGWAACQDAHFRRIAALGLGGKTIPFAAVWPERACQGVRWLVQVGIINSIVWNSAMCTNIRAYAHACMRCCSSSRDATYMRRTTWQRCCPPSATISPHGSQSGASGQQPC